MKSPSRKNGEFAGWALVNFEREKWRYYTVIAILRLGGEIGL